MAGALLQVRKQTQQSFNIQRSTHQLPWWSAEHNTGWQELHDLSQKALLPLRREIQMIFQDPFASLNPRMTVQEILAEPLIIHRIGDKASRRQKVNEILLRVRLDPESASRFPHAFSERQDGADLRRHLRHRPGGSKKLYRQWCGDDYHGSPR